MTKPERIAYLEPSSSRTIYEWRPDTLRSIRATADQGHLQLAADFCEWAMSSDDRVVAAIGTRTKGLVALPLSFDAARGHKRLVKALEAGEDWWASYPATELSALLAWGIMLGIGLGQQVWTDRGLSINRLVPKLKVWNPRHLRWDGETRRWMLRVADGSGSKEIVVTPGDGTWILYTPYGESRPWARGAWRAIALWATLKAYAIEDWARYSERHGQGTPVIEAPEQSQKDKRQELAAALRELGSEAAIVLPPGFTYKLVEAVADTWETFQAQKNAADLGTSVAILGQNLSTEVTGPVSTGATLHGRVLQTYIDTDAETLTTCVHDQSLVWWAEFNFGARDAAPWPVYATKPPEDRKANVDILAKVAEALNVLTNANAPVDVRLLLEHYGVPLKDKRDVEQSGQVFKYHLDYGVLTLNEIREGLGLPKVKGGDEPPKAVAAAAAPAAEEGGEEEDDADEEDEEDESQKRYLVQGHGANRKVIGTLRGPRPGTVLTRAGRKVPKRSGLVQGQLYTDDVVEAARTRAASVLDEDVVAVLEAIEAGESYDDVRKRLAKTFRGMKPDKLAKLTEAAITMTQLGGRHAILEDT